MNIYFDHGCKSLDSCIKFAHYSQCYDTKCPYYYTYRTYENTGKLVTENNKLSWYKIVTK